MVFALVSTPAASSLVSSSLIVNVSSLYPKPSKPTMRSVLTPLMKARTHGRTWILSLVTRKGAFSTFILRNRVSKCLGANALFLPHSQLSSDYVWGNHGLKHTSRCSSITPQRAKSGLKKCTTHHFTDVVRSINAFSSTIVV